MIKIFLYHYCIYKFSIGYYRCYITSFTNNSVFTINIICFFQKVQKKFHVWFTDTKLYHKYLKTFVEQKAMTRKQKWQLMIFVDIILLSSFFLVESIPLKILIILVDVIKYVYFFTKVKTITIRS